MISTLSPCSPSQWQAQLTTAGIKVTLSLLCTSAWFFNPSSSLPMLPLHYCPNHQLAPRLSQSSTSIFILPPHNIFVNTDLIMFPLFKTFWWIVFALTKIQYLNLPSSLVPLTPLLPSSPFSWTLVPHRISACICYFRTSFINLLNVLHVLEYST